MYEIFENKYSNFPIPNEVFWDALLRKQETVLLLPWIIHILKNGQKSTVPFGSQKLLTLYLEELLIHMIRRYTIAHYSASAGIYDSCQTSSETCRNIIHYLGEHVRQSLTIEDISKDNMIGRSQLQKLFREEYQCGVIEFFSRMKIDFAKQLIRENDMNFTQISDFLGYSSIHYFPDSSKSCPA